MSSAQETYYTAKPQHDLLKRFAGEWQFEKLSPPEESATPQNLGTGEMSAQLLGDYFAVCKWSGSLYETSFEAIQTLGYDAEKSQYSGYWVDSIMNYQWQFNGSLEAGSNELVITANGPAPEGGTAQFRERYQFKSTDTIEVVAQMLQEGNWATFMITRLLRKN